MRNIAQNTSNTERVVNTESALNVELVLNVEREVVYKSNDDILEILRTHPDFARVEPDSMQALLAALLSGVMVAGGASLLYVTGGAALGPMVLELYLFWSFRLHFPLRMICFLEYRVGLVVGDWVWLI